MTSLGTAGDGETAGWVTDGLLSNPKQVMVSLCLPKRMYIFSRHVEAEDMSSKGATFFLPFLF